MSNEMRKAVYVETAKRINRLLNERETANGKAALAKGAHAGKIAGKVAALTGGKGGGRPDSAMAGVGDKYKIDEALDQADEIAAEFLTK